MNLNAEELQTLFARLGPSLGVWRAAEIAMLRTQTYEPPVLDLGCGDGIVTSFVLPRVDIGVDPSSAALARAASLNLYDLLIAEPIETTALADASVGSIISNSVLEHVPDLSVVLGTVARLLRPGGRLVFTVPTEAFTRWLALPLGRYGNWRNRHYEHRNLWTVTEWRDQLARAGLTLTTVRPYLRRPIVALWDALELLQRARLGRRRLFAMGWRRLPASALARLADRAARMDLSAPEPGGGRLMIAERR